jgi:DNA-binding MarR family transcriptional regulator
MANPPGFNPHFYGIGSFGYLIRRLLQLMVENIETRFTGEAITFSQFLALISLNAHESRTAADVARFLGHDAGATTRLIDQLEQRGLLSRERNTADRRVVDLTVTASGKAMIRRCAATAAGFHADLLGDMPPAELAKLMRQLSRLVEKLKAAPAEQ